MNNKIEKQIEIYNPKEALNCGLRLQSLPNMTEGKEYEILSEKPNDVNTKMGMTYTVKDDKGDIYYISDKYFCPKPPVLAFENEFDKVYHDSFAKSIPSNSPTSLKFNQLTGICNSPTLLEINQLAGTHKDKPKTYPENRNIRETKSSIESELEILRKNCLTMLDNIDSLIATVETMRKFS